MSSRTNWRKPGALVSIAAVALLVAGCISKVDIPQPPSPTKANITVRVEIGANPDSKGRGLPVVVRLFQVKAPGEFEQSDFFALMDQSPSLLADGYQLLDELEMVGGQERESLHELDPSAGYVGAIAAFRQIHEANWMGILPVKGESLNEVTVSVSGLDLTVSSEPAP